MRAEKKILAKEVASYLDKSDFVFLANYTGINVSDTAELRDRLSKKDAEFHVVKNSALDVAAKEKELPSLDDALSGPTAIVVGGSDPAEIAKIIVQFHKDTEKVEIKAGILGDSYLSPDEVEQLSKLPSKEVLQGQLLGLFNQPAEQLVRVLNAVPQNVLNVLDAKKRKDEEAA